ncbi:ketoacyl-ACP synthase III [Shewanella sp. Choline-02u-19]|uniref:3-oxoacyl-ACP synthase III family protein n=1 Tax=unclassified Shewanella TaxID=196818 RepID=UPI000C32FF44|nr:MULTISPECIES: beta-ketoacyl-ACP synthase III [unclassified Shewanella]PKH62385.1 ketoacyl-ACP synthase III [Shewanella sp. Bg11-22]PKI26916.1 ketoacyl-ACP synthase III [Shewanella sp. Choline-02u-19]
MKQIVRNVKILGTGSYTPEYILTNEELSKMVSTTPDWIEKNLGIKERRIVKGDECTSDLASKAALSAIDNAGLTKDDIDLIIVATATPDRPAPSTAAIVQDKISASNAVAFDISAVCSGFLYGMSVASAFISSGVYDNVLVIGADTFSKITDWTRRDAVFFGDGAGAAVLTNTKETEGFLATRLYTDGSGKFNFTVPAGGSEIPTTQETVEQGLHFFQMNGQAVFDTATKALPKAINQVLEDTGLKVDDIDLMIPHQPSIRILQKTAEIIGLPFDKVMTNMDKYANTSGGTIPILLDEMHRSGRIKKGDIILFAAVGSGWAYGASIIKWA